MSNKQVHKLSDLKDLEKSPPAFLYDRIKASVEKEEEEKFKKILGFLTDHAVEPVKESFDSIMDDIHAEKTDPRVKLLRNYSKAAPFTFSQLLAKAKALGATGKVISISGYAKKIAAAAAILLVAVIAYFLVNRKNSSTESFAKTNIPVKENSIASPEPTSPPTTGTGTATKNNKVEIADAAPVTKPLLPSPARVNKTNKAATAAYTKTTPVQIDGNYFRPRNNDYLAMFTSFNLNTAPPFLRGEEASEGTITVDKFTSITISKGMAAILRKTYRTKKNGRPTRRARKQREKIEKWKKADNDYFNKNSTMNPLDPMDLGDFILYK